jgi:hypothetical protein
MFEGHLDEFLLRQYFASSKARLSSDGLNNDDSVEDSGSSSDKEKNDELFYQFFIYLFLNFAKIWEKKRPKPDLHGNCLGAMGFPALYKEFKGSINQISIDEWYFLLKK